VLGEFGFVESVGQIFAIVQPTGCTASDMLGWAGVFAVFLENTYFGAAALRQDFAVFLENTYYGAAALGPILLFS